MIEPGSVAEHYSQSSIIAAIEAGLAKLGKTTSTVSVEDLGPVDEFHIGGRAASEALFEHLDVAPASTILDIGCGIGGTARYVAHRFGCNVTGIDLTAPYIEAGNILNTWVGLGHKISLHQGSALQMPFSDKHFDGAYLMHVGMNIEDKRALFKEVARKLKTGSTLCIYDIMRVAEGSLEFPMPWATHAGMSAVEPLTTYDVALKQAGFDIVTTRDRGEFARDFFKTLRAKISEAGGPAPLGLHILMGSSAPHKLRNMMAAVDGGVLAPIEIVAKRK